MKPSNSTLASLGLGLPIAIILAWLASLAGIEMPGEVQTALGVVIGGAIGYFFDGGKAEQTVATMTKQGGYARLGMLLMLLTVAACGTLNPFQFTKTPLDKANAALRLLEISQEQVLTLVNDRATPPGVVSVLKQASRDATVAARQLGEATLEYQAARAELVAGGPTAAGRMQVANEKLLQWTETLLARVASIKSAVKGAR